MDYFVTADKFKYFDERLKGINYSNPTNPDPLTNAMAMLVIEGTPKGMTAKGGIQNEFASSVTYHEAVETLVKHVVVHQGCIGSHNYNTISRYDDTIGSLWRILRNNPSEIGIKAVTDTICTNRQVCKDVAGSFVDDNVKRTFMDKTGYQKFQFLAEVFNNIDNYYQHYNGHGQK